MVPSSGSNGLKENYLGLIFPTVSALITHNKTSAQTDFGLGHVFILLGWVDKEAEVMATILSPWERSMSNEASRGNRVRKTENLGVGDVT